MNLSNLRPFDSRLRHLMWTAVPGRFITNNFIRSYYLESFKFKYSFIRESNRKRSYAISQHVEYEMQLSTCFHLMAEGLRE